MPPEHARSGQLCGCSFDEKMKTTVKGPMSTAIRCFLYYFIAVAVAVTPLLFIDKGTDLPKALDIIVSIPLMIVLFPTILLGLLPNDVTKNMSPLWMAMNPIFWAALGYTIHKVLLHYGKNNKKSIADIIGPWVDPNWDSGLIERCKNAWNTPLNKLTNEELATFLRQDIATQFILPIAEDRIKNKIDDNTEMFDGELESCITKSRKTIEHAPPAGRGEAPRP